MRIAELALRHVALLPQLPQDQLQQRQAPWGSGGDDQAIDEPAATLDDVEMSQRQRVERREQEAGHVVVRPKFFDRLVGNSS